MQHARSPYLTGLIEEFAPDKHVLRVGIDGLEDAVESGQARTNATTAILERHLAQVVESDADEAGTAPAQTLVKLLARLERYSEAVDVFREHLGEADPTYLRCLNPRQLCQVAGDYERLRQLAREDGDLISYTAASIQR